MDRDTAVREGTGRDGDPGHWDAAMAFAPRDPGDGHASNEARRRFGVCGFWLSPGKGTHRPRREWACVGTYRRVRLGLRRECLVGEVDLLVPGRRRVLGRGRRGGHVQKRHGTSVLPLRRIDTRAPVMEGDGPRSCARCPCVRALASRATRASAGVHSRALPCPCGVAGARAPVEQGPPREGRSHDRRSVFYFGIE